MELKSACSADLWDRFFSHDAELGSQGFDSDRRMPRDLFWQSGYITFVSLDVAVSFRYWVRSECLCDDIVFFENLGTCIEFCRRMDELNLHPVETATIPGVESVPPAPPKKRGRPPLPEGQKKTRAQIQAEYRARRASKNFEIPGDLYMASVAALQAAVDCPMLKKEDRHALADLLRKLGG